MFRALASRAVSHRLVRRHGVPIGLFLLAGFLIAAGHTRDETPEFVSPATFAASGGLVRFESLDAGARDIVESGIAGLSPVEITGLLVLPESSDGRVPAAVLVHGSDGAGDHELRYARLLAEHGIAAFVLDSFSTRGVRDTIADQRLVPARSMLIDAYRALDLLAEHPRIDPSRIAVIGWSKGGMVADWASRERFRSVLAAGDRRFAAHVAFYSWCGEQEVRVNLTGAPILFLAAGRDDWSGSTECLDYVARLQARAYDGRIVLYPDAEHAFDHDGTFRAYLPEAESWARCGYLVGDEGVLDGRRGETVPAADRYDDLVAGCESRGAHIGSHAGARRDSQNRVLQFLDEVFGPPGANPPSI